MPVFAIGTALGALLAYFFDPQNGNRRRKLAVDRTAGFVRRRGRETARTGRAVAAEAHGVSQKCCSWRQAVWIAERSAMTSSTRCRRTPSRSAASTSVGSAIATWIPSLPTKRTGTANSRCATSSGSRPATVGSTDFAARSM